MSDLSRFNVWSEHNDEGDVEPVESAKLTEEHPDLKLSSVRPLKIATGAEVWAGRIGLSLQAEGKADEVLALGCEVAE